MSVRDQVPDSSSEEKEEKKGSFESFGGDDSFDFGEEIDTRDDGYPTDGQLKQWWQEHQETPEDDYEARNKIMKSLDGYVHTAVQPYNKSPESMRRQKVQEEMIKSIERWDPERAPLRNYVWGNIFPNGHEGMSIANKVEREYGGTKKILHDHLGDVEKARELREKFKSQRGRDPSVGEIADELGIDEDRASKIVRQESATHYTDDLIDDNQSFQDYGQEEMDALRAVYSSLTGRKKRIMEMLFYPDLGGKEPESYSENQDNWPVQKEIAEEIGVSGATIYRSKKSIKKRIQDVL